MSNPQSPSNPSTYGASRPWLGWLIVLAAAAATFGLGILAASILHRREEAAQRVPLRPIDDMEMDSARWAENYPREYDSYRRMDDSSPATATRYGGASKRDYLAEAPATVILFAGSTFDEEYLQAAGHTHAITDVTETLRTKIEDPTTRQWIPNPQKPATCWTCKSPDVPRMMKKLGGVGDDGPAKFYAMKFVDLKSEITHPIGCYDCHEANSMKLRITRPALLEAMKRRDPNFDIDKVSHQEMRSLVCAQCHVTYYFKGKGNYLTFPWDKGTSPEKMEEYFDEADFADFTNPVSKTRNLKIRHPDYELYSTGIHAYRNVACADCHMPYRTEGGVKFTDHHLQSPLHNIANSCAVCHRWSEQEIRTRVESIQDKIREARNRAEDDLAKAHLDIAAAVEAGAKDDELAGPRKQVRHAQLRWDYIAASNGMGFHSPAEALRVLTGAVDLAGQARLQCARILAQHGYAKPVAYPDFSTKDKAQALVKAFAAGKPPKLLADK